jgi:hypothetical protein
MLHRAKGAADEVAHPRFPIYKKILETSAKRKAFPLLRALAQTKKKQESAKKDRKLERVDAVYLPRSVRVARHS